MSQFSASPVLLIRADATPEMGTGHVMRCVALGQGWQRAGGRVVFACASLPGTLHQRLIQEGCEVVMLETAAGDSTATLACYRSTRARCLVIDGYQFDNDYRTGVVEAGAVALVIDDGGQENQHAAHWILNQNIGAEASLYSRCSERTRLLLGTQYALLRKEFVELVGWQRTIPPSAKRVLLTMGGSDPDNLTGSLLSILTDMPGIADWQLRAVVGPANPHAGALAARWQGTQVELVQNPPSMPPHLQWADIVITAGGGTIWEVLFMGLPSVVVSIAQNQDQICEALKQKSLAVTVELNPDSPNLMMVAEAAVRLALQPEERRRLSKVGPKLVDGLGADRVVAEILNNARFATK